MRKLNLLDETLEATFILALQTVASGGPVGPIAATGAAIGLCELVIVACADHREWAEHWANEIRADPNPHSASVSAREFVERIPWPE